MEIPEEALENYIRSEFRAMDINQDGKLHRNEVLKLLTLLGYDKGEQKLKVHNSEINKFFFFFFFLFFFVFFFLFFFCARMICALGL